MSHPADTPHLPEDKRLPMAEFVALIAMLYATIAFSIDGLLPAEPAIIAAFTPDDPNRAKLAVQSFFLGLGIGTLFTGPLSDAFGRKPIIILGGVIYSVAALICLFARSLEVLLVARALQGLGGAGPRTVALAMVRDIYKGRAMAQIMSFAMMVFMVAPAAAPLLGQQVMLLAGWQSIFVAFVVFSVASVTWLGLRQPETLPRPARRRLSWRGLLSEGRELITNRIVVVSILIQGLTMAVLMSTISSVQGIFRVEFAMEQAFPRWFALSALVSASASFLNARIVMKVGMRRVASLAYAATLALTLVQLALILSGVVPEALRFPAFFVWMVSLFCMMSLTMGNLNALAMEPMGHMAGFAASVISAGSTVLAVVISTPVAQLFDGTHLPLALGSALFLAGSLGMMPLLRAPRPR